MQIEFRDVPAAGYVHATASGDVGLSAYRAIVDAVAAYVASGGRPRVLVDISGMKGVLADLDRYEIGVYGAQKLAAVERFAVVTSRAQRPNWLSEDAARNRGLPARLFLDAGEALRWLTSP